MVYPELLVISPTLSAVFVQQLIPLLKISQEAQQRRANSYLVDILNYHIALLIINGSSVAG